MRESATSRSRSRSSGALTLALLLGCGPEQTEVRGTPMAQVGDEVLYREVVTEMAARESIGEDEARARAIETLQLVAARREELAGQPEPPADPDDLDPARARQLERAALARLWLREHFEPDHEPSDMPESVVDQAMANPSVFRRLFHPEVWVTCQALIVPAAKGEDGRNLLPPNEAEAGEAWRARAELALAGFAARADWLADDLVRLGDCKLFSQLIETSQTEFPAVEGDGGRIESGPLLLRFEQFGFAPSAHALDPGWVEQVTREARPRLVGPFDTPFGRHLVLVAKIEPANLEDGSLPAAELDAARREQVREHLRDQWRAERLEVEIQRSRDDRVVRLSTELERGR